MRVWIKGAGDLATGIACRLHRSGFQVMMTEIEVPTTVRRTVAFSPVVYEGEAVVEGIRAVRCETLEAADEAVNKGLVAVLVDETGETRRELEERYDEIGGAAMLRELSQLDPERAAKLHPRDKKRVVRAYEVYLLTGRTITELDEASRLRPPDFDAAYIILGWASREEMYARTDARVDEMVSLGLFEEVRRLLDAGLGEGCTAMQAIGYKEAAAALRGDCSREEAIETIKRETRRYAKRQLTWLRSRRDALRIDWQGRPDFEAAVRDSTEYLLRCGI